MNPVGMDSYQYYSNEIQPDYSNKSGNKNIYDVIQREVPKVSPDLSLNNLFELVYNTPIPVAVVEGNKLKGIIIRGSVLAALAGSEVNIDDGTNTPNTLSRMG